MARAAHGRNTACRGLQGALKGTSIREACPDQGVVVRALRVQEPRRGRRAGVLGGLFIGLAAVPFIQRIRGLRPVGANESALAVVPPTHAARSHAIGHPPASSEKTRPLGNADNRLPANPNVWDYSPDACPDRHSAHSRPVAWVVVAIIIAGFCVAGLALVLSAPWLFWTGIGLILLGTVLGRLTHAIRQQTRAEAGYADR